jgi:hypothetical protein
MSSVKGDENGQYGLRTGRKGGKGGKEKKEESQCAGPGNDSVERGAYE